jgi:hypothetical protein
MRESESESERQRERLLRMAMMHSKLIRIKWGMQV